MSIATKKGDDGHTDVLYQRRVSKAHPQLEACGTVDELNAALGLARATASDAWVRDQIQAVQADLIVLMAQLATLPEDAPRYTRDGYRQIGPAHIARLDELIRRIESGGLRPQGWAYPGANLHSAALELARTVCRRAERRVCALQQAQPLANPNVLAYLNRLGDALWLLARLAETQGGSSAPTPTSGLNSGGSG
jgi:cob(I)alamin adenosyltransferase